MASEFTLDFPKAYPQLEASAIFRTEPADFFVDEILGFEPAGSGEHALLHIEKTGLNTQDVVQSLAAYAGVKLMDVGYCGLKDRHAVTEQWFCLHLPGKEGPDFSQWSLEDCEILSTTRQKRKLRIGTLKGNDFALKIRNISDKNDVESRLNIIATQGVPNYFGEQRFGPSYNCLPKDGYFSNPAGLSSDYSLLVSANSAYNSSIRSLIDTVFLSTPSMKQPHQASPNCAHLPTSTA